jgi:enoyl-CoA hydratase/carnithine racemase
MRTPTIGAINGATFTGGLELALGCDFLIASERAVFADTHALVGILPGGGMTARLPNVVGSAMARRMSMTGEVVDAARAERIGLITEVVAHDRLLDRALELATQSPTYPDQRCWGSRRST